MKTEQVAQHTPGPWRHELAEPGEPGPFVIESLTGLIAEVGTCGEVDAEDEANARLIAAAPELLRATYDAEAVLSDIECGHDKPLATGFVLDQLRKAITKATNP